MSKETEDPAIKNTSPSSSKNGSWVVWGCWFAAVLLPMLWMWPKFENPSFSLIDDPKDISVFKSMESDFSSWWDTSGFHGERQGGRLRPVYWLSRFVFHYLPLGDKHDPFMWYVLHYLTLAAIISAAFYLVYRLARCPWAALTACALWVLNAKTMENFVRLSPAENWQLFWLSLSGVAVYHLFRIRAGAFRAALFVSIFILWFLFFFSKETSVLLLPAVILAWLGSAFLKKGFREWSIFAAMALFLFCLQRLLAPPMVGYSSAFTLSPETIAANLKLYVPRIQWFLLAAAAAVSFAIREIRALLRTRRLPDNEVTWWQFFLLVLAVEFFVILLPWSLPEPRYLVVTDYLLAAFIALELARLYTILKEFKPAKPFKKALMPAFAAAVFGLASASDARFYVELKYALGQAGHPTPVQALEFFARNAPPNARVLAFYLEDEPQHSALILLKDFFGRPDIQVYTFSQKADERRNLGYSVVPITPDMWPGVLNEIDFVLWTRRGIKKVKLDVTNARMVRMILDSEFGINLTELYNDLYYPFHPKIPEGTQIWKIDHNAVAKFRAAARNSEKASTETAE